MNAPEAKDGGPAFPHVNIPRPDLGAGISQQFTDGGMTLRDYFAAKALAALLGRIDTVSGDYVTNATYEDGAQAAYCYADAMLAARASIGRDGA